MRVAVVGGTGTLGTLVVAELGQRGHDAAALSHHASATATSVHRRVDLTTGEGLQTALLGIDAVIDASDASASRRRMQAVLLDGTRRLLRAESDAGVRHHVLISIVGIDDVPLGYYRVKLEQERLVTGSDMPATVLRATQFHQLLDKAFTVVARCGVLPGGRIPFQPVDAHEVACALVDAVEDGPGQGPRQLAGPAVMLLRELAQTWLASRHLRRLLVPVPAVGRVGRAVRAGRLTAPDAPRGVVSFARWLAEKEPDISPEGGR